MAIFHALGNFAEKYWKNVLTERFESKLFVYSIILKSLSELYAKLQTVP